MRRWRRRLLVALGLLVLFAGVAAFFGSLFLPASSQKRVERVSIPQGATANKVANLLAQRGLIRSRLAFVVTARVLGEAQNLQAGEYELDARLGLMQLIEKIARGDAIAQWVTVPEGYTIPQIATLLGQRQMGDPRVFEDLCDTDPAKYLDVRVPRNSLEGYLLPDSYQFKTGVTEAAIVKAMTGNFRKQVLEGLSSELQASGRSVDEVVIIASLIEREAKVPKDRELISAVIRNRLKQKMPLQIDATVLYALGRHQERVLFKDLKVDHPYNTYRNRGLPPGPICNPGVACIRAALHPADADYLYYVAQKDGSHYFSKTYGEHLRH